MGVVVDRPIGNVGASACESAHLPRVGMYVFYHFQRFDGVCVTTNTTNALAHLDDLTKPKSRREQKGIGVTTSALIYLVCACMCARALVVTPMPHDDVLTTKKQKRAKYR